MVTNAFGNEVITIDGPRTSTTVTTRTLINVPIERMTA